MANIKYDKSQSKKFGGETYYYYKQAAGKVNARNIIKRLRGLKFRARLSVNVGRNTGGWPIKIYNIWVREV